jgi:type IV pilus assembly protein PilX
MKKIDSAFAEHGNQRGFVLVIALIVLAAMSLAAIALVRTVDTSTLLARNISFKRDAINRNELALEVANAFFREGGVLASQLNTRVDLPANNYSSSMVATDADGIPTALGSDFTTFPQQINASGEQTQIHYIIERMCTRGNVAENKSHCLLAQAASGSEQPEKRPVTLPPMYRVSTRVVAPRNVSSVTQAIIVPTIRVNK